MSHREGSLPYEIKQALDYTRGLIRKSTDAPGPHTAKFDPPGKMFGTDAESDAIKEAIRIYVQSWILPHLESAYERVCERSALPRRTPAGKHRVM